MIIKISTNEIQFEFADPKIIYAGYAGDGASSKPFVIMLSEIIQKVVDESLKLRKK